MKLVVDTDIDFDDVLALILMYKRADVEVVAITVTGAGMTYLDSAVVIARKLVYLSGKDIAIGIGGEKPLVGDREFPKEWRDDTTEGLLSLLSSVPEVEAKVEGKATDILSRYLVGDTRLVVLGPATNVGEFLLMGYTLPKSVTLMGGSIGDHKGSVVGERYVEYNSWLDPVAFGTVVRGSVSLVPLNVTDKVPSNKSPLPKGEDFMSSLARNLVLHQMKVNYPEPTFLWDPLATLIAVSSEEELSKNTKYMKASIGVDSLSGRINLYALPVSRVYYDVNPQWFYSSI